MFEITAIKSPGLSRVEGLVARRLALVAIIFSIFYFLFSILFIRPVHAQTTTDNCQASSPAPNAQPASNPLTAQEAIDKINKCAIQKNVFDDKIFNINQIAGTTDSLYNLLTGKSQLHPETNGVTAGTGALAASGRLVAALYSKPPISGVEYFAQKIHDINPVKPAYAQTGIGFNALVPVQEIWTVFRNIAYVGFVIVFVIMGFMIMFRAHISPQAVATVQDSIPRIVIALILVTFSYAIAGLMIDIMFVFLNIVINALAAPGVNLLNPNNKDIVFQHSVFGVIFSAWKDTFSTVADAVFGVIDKTISIPVLDKVFGFFGAGLAAIVMGIAVLFIMFRVFFMLLMAYAMIIILTMTAPFFFLIQALPGRNGAGEWFKQMASQIVVFPTVALMFIFAGILGGIGALGGTAPGAIGQGQVGQFPLLAGGINPNDIGKLIGLGLLLMTPSAAELVRNALGVKGGVQGAAGQAGAALLGAGAAAGGFARRRVAESAPGQAFRQISERAGERRARAIRYAVPERFGGGAESEPPPQQVTLEPPPPPRRGR